MNQDNYATLEASKRLIDAGIVLETYFYWYEYEAATLASLRDGKKLLPESYIVTKESVCKNSHHWIPAPCMAEVLKELPFQTYIKKIDDGSSLVWYCDDWRDDGKELVSEYFSNTNPTDALIDLLIWLE